jgi:L-tartrate/succinate antiporter
MSTAADVIAGVGLADGLNRVGSVKGLANSIAGRRIGFSPILAMVVVVAIFFTLDRVFASITAHVDALLPVMATVGSTVQGLPMQHFTVLLLLTLGIMGILTPYATGPSPVYCGSGYIRSGSFCQFGAIFGVSFHRSASRHRRAMDRRPRVSEVPIYFIGTMA